MGSRRRQGLGGLWNNAPARPARIRWCWPTSLSANGITSASSWSASASRFTSTTSWWSTSRGCENYLATRQAAVPQAGPIQLQTHGGEIRWRNMFIREIPVDEANEILRKHGHQGLRQSIFNGKDFTGWDGRIDNYEVKDGAIVCRPKKGGTIFTKEEYADFVARVEFQLPPGRQQRPGHPLSRLRRHRLRRHVRDPGARRHDRRQYDKLDPRQYHGSVYGMVAAQRGYLRPVGEWNFEEVTVKGSNDQGGAERHRHPRRRREQSDQLHGQQCPPGQGLADRAISASPAIMIRSRSAMSRSRSWTRSKAVAGFVPLA